MDLQSVHVNSIKVQFEANSKMPSDTEIFAFFRMQKWKPETLVAMFRVPREYCVYVKFQSEDILKKVLLQCSSSGTFHYDNGEMAKITFATAKGDFRYVRLFGLPIEVDDKHVVNALGKFGEIHRVTRERYGADTGFPILNGVRGVHLELAKAIPEQLHVQHFRVHVAYEGMQSKCFVCSSTDHIKANCPKRSSEHRGKTSGGGTLSYADALLGIQKESTATSSGTSVQPNETQSKSAAQITTEPTDATNDNTEAFREMAFGSTGEETEAQCGEGQKDKEDSLVEAAKERDRAIRISHPSANGSDSSESEERPGIRKIPRPPFRISELQSIANRTRLQNNQKKCKNNANL